MASDDRTSDTEGGAPEERGEAPGPQQIAHYAIESVVASGGFGTVCRATDTTLGRTVALKLIDDPKRAPSLIEEARNTSRVSHPRIAQVYQAGIDEPTGLSFIAFEWVEGPTLRALLRQGELPMGNLLRLGQDIASAVAAAHAEGLVHGDLKADNVVVSGDPGRAKLLDFGLSVPDEQLGSGEIWGTPAYMAPELLAGAPRTRESDLFALGVLLFELATGELPFGGEDGDEHGVRVRQSDPAPDPREKRLDLPSDLNDQIRTLLSRNPQNRGPDAEELARGLRLRRRAEERPRGRFVPALVMVLIFAGLAWGFRDRLGMGGGSGAGQGSGTAVAPRVSVGRWTGADGEETEESRRLQGFLRVLLDDTDPGSALLRAATPPAIVGTVTVEADDSGPGTWTARWTSPTGRGSRDARAPGALALARSVAERVIRDGSSNRVAPTVDVPEEALLLFCEGVRLAAERGELAEARETLARARERAGAFPEAAAWEAALWIVEGRPGEALSLLAPLDEVPSAPAQILRSVLEVPVRDRRARWGEDHRFARLLDLALARHDSLVPDPELARLAEAERSTGLPWISRLRAEIALRAGDAALAAEAIEPLRFQLESPDSPILWRLEYRLSLSPGEDREAAREAFQDRLFELPDRSPARSLRIPFLLQGGKPSRAADLALESAPGDDSAVTAVLVLAIAGRGAEASERARGIEDPFDPSLPYRLRAAIDILEGDRIGAQGALQQARQFDPDKPEIALLLRFVEDSPFSFEGSNGEAGTAASRFAAPFEALRLGRSLRVGQDPAAGRRALDALSFVADDLTVFPWPETIYLGWLERIACLRAEGKVEEARRQWKSFRRWWPEDRAPDSRVGALAREVEMDLESAGKTGE